MEVKTCPVSIWFQTNCRKVKFLAAMYYDAQDPRVTYQFTTSNKSVFQDLQKVISDQKQVILFGINDQCESHRLNLWPECEEKAIELKEQQDQFQRTHQTKKIEICKGIQQLPTIQIDFLCRQVMDLSILVPEHLQIPNDWYEYESSGNIVFHLECKKESEFDLMMHQLFFVLE